MVIVIIIERHCYFLARNNRTSFAICSMLDCVRLLRQEIAASKQHIDDAMILAVINLASVEVRNIVKSYLHLLKFGRFSGEKIRSIGTI